MKYFIDGCFFTDGDYKICIDNFDEEYQQFVSVSDEDGYCYVLSFETEDAYEARDFLEQLSVSFHVSWTHHYILPDLYSMVNAIAEALFNKDIKHIEKTYNGNYEGTKLSLAKIDENKN